MTVERVDESDDYIFESIKDVMETLDDLYVELGEQIGSNNHPTKRFDIETWVQINRIMDAYNILRDVKVHLQCRNRNDWRDYF